VISGAGAEGLLALRLEEFLEALATNAPVPASGSAAAIVGAMAAELVAMTARAATGWNDAAGVAAQARGLAARLRPLATADADAFARVLALRADPGSDARDLGPALERSMAVPLEIADACAATAELAAIAASHAVGHERGDAVAAAALAEGATRAAAALVMANLMTVAGDDRSSRAADLVRVAAAARERALEAT
jgi:glutamate formiminotransferase/formiminotetrahydrofolate cyclodeaminase